MIYGASQQCLAEQGHISNNSPRGTELALPAPAWARGMGKLGAEPLPARTQPGGSGSRANVCQAHSPSSTLLPWQHCWSQPSSSTGISFCPDWSLCRNSSGTTQRPWWTSAPAPFCKPKKSQGILLKDSKAHCSSLWSTGKIKSDKGC